MFINEENTKLRFITPAIENSGWDKQTQIDCEYSFTDGQIVVRGKIYTRGSRKKVDYLLSYKKNLPIAIIEAKDNTKTASHGIQQALNYAELLDVPFVYSSNGKSFFEHDRITGIEREIPLNEFPTPDELWKRFKSEKNIDSQKEKIITEPYYFKIGDKSPRYYQRIAINKTVEAVASGQNRILLVMATGTGKTFTAFQIIHRLYTGGLKKKILYLADRNILIDQTIQNDFKPFSKIITKVENKKLDSSYEIYMSLYQQLSTSDNLEIFRQFKDNFFDLIVVDECHRGSAKEDSNWRKILEYFSSATQIGMTATPKEDNKVSNIEYFGEPIYTYSLKQGIEDGFLAPYKVIKIGLNTDLEGYRPEIGKLDIDGNLIEDREYNIKDFDKTIIIDERTKLVAKIISDYIKKTDRFQKTIIFCVDIDHAERMRIALTNENSDLVKENSKYIMRITGDNKEGKAQIDNFIDVNEKYPAIVTTSKLMTTGVDCKTCKLIVLENNINSMTEFKQIIGRGTRIREDCGKTYFTIMDFRNSTKNFSDSKFDGEPVQIKTVNLNQNNSDEEEVINQILEDDNKQEVEYLKEVNLDNTINEEDNKVFKKITINNVNVTLLSNRVQYLDTNGKLITESLIDYTKRNILGKYSTLDSFLNTWNSTLKKEAIIKELEVHGVLLDCLREESKKQDLDDFDLICHIAYDKKPLTRSERINNVKKEGCLYKYSEIAQNVLNQLLNHYMNEGINDLSSIKILKIKFNNEYDILKEFGGKDKYFEAVKDLEKEIYKVI
mgnify:CR=1 FL=1